VKKLKNAKNRSRKPLITNARISWFLAFRQFFHSFSAMAGGARTFLSAETPEVRADQGIILNLR